MMYRGLHINLPFFKGSVARGVAFQDLLIGYETHDGAS